VRDNIHAHDVCEAIARLLRRPAGRRAVYNLGGGRANSVSVLEAIARLEEMAGRRLVTEYVDKARVGDHICYISDLRPPAGRLPGWSITRSLDDILRELIDRPASA
jgi:CDP-paratose 2-epimerase